MKRNEKIFNDLKMDTFLAIAAGLSFYVLCMVLPLVGPTGSRVEHALKNKVTFLSVLMATFILAATSTYKRIERRKLEKCSFPWFQGGLSAVCVLILVTLLFNGLAI